MKNAIRNLNKPKPSAHISQKRNPFYQSGAVWVIECILPDNALACFCEGLSRFSDNYATYEIDTKPLTWRCVFYCTEKPQQDDIDRIFHQLADICDIVTPSYTLENLPDHDWVSEVQRTFQPFRIGRYFVCSSLFTDRPPHECHTLVIDASMAFGTGEHETTSGCLQALDQLAKRRSFTNMLDMGCGTGILAIAMAKTWKKPVLAVDIDAVAAHIADMNTERNHVDYLVQTGVSNGYRSPVVTRLAPYDLITANILADPLIAFAPQLKHHLAPKGIAVLSGLLCSQENNVLHSHRQQGLKLLQRIHVGHWSTLILQRV